MAGSRRGGPVGDATRGARASRVPGASGALGSSNVGIVSPSSRRRSGRLRAFGQPAASPILRPWRSAERARLSWEGLGDGAAHPRSYRGGVSRSASARCREPGRAVGGEAISSACPGQLVPRRRPPAPVGLGEAGSVRPVPPTITTAATPHSRASHQPTSYPTCVDRRASAVRSRPRGAGSRARVRLSQHTDLARRGRG